MSLAGVVMRYRTGTYLVKRHAQSARVDGMYIPSASVDLDAVDVDATTDEITIVAHGLVTGQGPLYPTADVTLPSGLVASTLPVWAIKVDDDTIKLASSRANAIALTPIDLTDEGVGVLHLSTDVLIDASIQPAAMDIEDEPQGQRMQDTKTIFTIYPIYGRGEGGFDPDVVVIDGEEWRVDTVDFFGILSQHYRGTLTRMETP